MLTRQLKACDLRPETSSYQVLEPEFWLNRKKNTPLGFTIGILLRRLGFGSSSSTQGSKKLGSLYL